MTTVRVPNAMQKGVFQSPMFPMHARRKENDQWPLSDRARCRGLVANSVKK
jgi:hypothetical protein